jgi:acyl-CoA thioester hydrolase
VNNPTPCAGVVEPVPVYFDDLDAMGMVHNARYIALFERGVAAYFARAGYTLAKHEDVIFVVKSMNITYERPLTTIGTVDLAFWVETIGRTSVRFGFRFQTGADVHAYGQRTVVRIDPSTLRPAAWTEPIRRLFTAELLVSEAIQPSS